MTVLPSPQSPDDELAAERRRVKVCIEFENAWKTGRRLPLESLCGEIPASERLDLLVELVGIELELRRASGDLPTEAEYVCRFAELAPFFPQLLNDACSSHVVTAAANRDKSRSLHDPKHSTSYGLLFGLLALQNNFINRDMLLTAFNRWVADKSQAIGKILVDSGAITIARHDVLESLVTEHLEQHRNDPAQSLAALSSIGVLRQDLEQVADSELTSIVAQVSSAPVEPSSDDTASWDQTSSLRGNRFRIMRPFDRQGNLGELFVAHDLEFHRDVLVKQIKEIYADQAETRGRFVVEAEVTGNLEHPGIVPVYGLGQYAGGRPYYAMRRIEGQNLKEAVIAFHQKTKERIDRAKKNLEFRTLLRHFIDACNAVAYAHSRGILHRDIKPHNIMIGRYGETFVIDWGLAKPVGYHFETSIPQPAETLNPASASGSPETVAGSVIGTPQYMSPEQASGTHNRVEAPSDVYSLGATLYFLLTGVPPFDGKVAQVLTKVVGGDFPSPTEVNRHLPKALAAICLKAMSLIPADRYSSADLMASDVERWIADEPVLAMQDPTIERAMRWARHHKPLVSAVLVLALVLPGAFATIAVNREQKIAAEAGKIKAEAEKEQAEAEKELANEKALSAEKLSIVQQYHALIAPPTEAERGRPGWTWNRLSKLQEAADLDVPNRDSALLRSEMANCLTAVDVREANAALQKLLVLEPKSRDASRIAFSSDGRYLALGQHKTTVPIRYQVRIVDLDRSTARPLWITPPISPVENQEGVRALTFTPNNRGLVIATRYGWLHYCDLSRPEEKPTKSWKGHNDGIFRIVVSPDGKWLFSAGDNEIKRWDLSTLSLEKNPAVKETTVEKTDRILDLELFPDNSLFFVTIATFREFNFEASDSGQKQFVNERRFQTVSPAPNGRTLAASVAKKVVLVDRSAVLIEPSQDEEIRTFEDPALLTRETHEAQDIIVRFSPNGSLLLTTSTREQDHSVKLWEVASGSLLIRIPLPGSVHDASFSPDGQSLAISTTEGTHLYEIGGIAMQNTVANQVRPISAFELDLAGKTLVCAGEPLSPHGQPRDAEISVWDTSSWNRTKHFSSLGKSDAFSGLSLHPNRTLLAASRLTANQISIFKLSGESEPFSIQVDSPAAVAFSPSGDRLWAAAGEMVQPWSTTDWAKHSGWSNFASKAITGATKIESIAVGREKVFAGVRDGKIRQLSNSENPQLLGAPWPFSSGPVSTVSLDSTEQFLAAGSLNGEVAVFRVPTGEIVASRKNAHVDTIHAISFSPDGKVLASGSKDSTIKLWLVATKNLEEIMTLRSPSGPIHTVRFSQDGTQLLTVGRGETAVRIWNLRELHAKFNSSQLDWE